MWFPRAAFAPQWEDQLVITRKNQWPINCTLSGPYQETLETPALKHRPWTPSARFSLSWQRLPWTGGHNLLQIECIPFPFFRTMGTRDPGGQDLLCRAVLRPGWRAGEKVLLAAAGRPLYLSSHLFLAQMFGSPLVMTPGGTKAWFIEAWKPSNPFLPGGRPCLNPHHLLSRSLTSCDLTSHLSASITSLQAIGPCDLPK